MSRRLCAAAAAVASMVAIAAPSAASAAPPSDSAELREAVEVAGVRDHMAALQEIADANDGIRASATPGYD